MAASAADCLCSFIATPAVVELLVESIIKKSLNEPWSQENTAEKSSPPSSIICIKEEESQQTLSVREQRTYECGGSEREWDK